MAKVELKYRIMHVWDLIRYYWCCFFHSHLTPLRAKGGAAYECPKCFVLHKVPFADQSGLVPPRVIYSGYDPPVPELILIDGGRDRVEHEKPWLRTPRTNRKAKSGGNLPGNAKNSV